MNLRSLLLVALTTFAVVGCHSDEGDSGPTPPPTKVEDLPQDMPPQARGQAEAAIKQQEAMAAQSKAMAEARKAAGR